MGMIYIKRVLHPVGHGAFFTEQFYDSDKGENVLNVVYDCGVMRNQALLEKEIDVVFALTDRKHVDYLFISHLDKDHVSGIKYLIDSHYVNDQTTFVLPLYEDYQLALYEEITGRGVLSIYEEIKQAPKRRVLFVPVSDGDTFVRRDDMNPIDMENEENVLGNDAKVNGLDGILIPKNSVFVWRQIWEYIPFNLHDSVSSDFFKKVSNHPDLAIQDLDDVKKIFENMCSANVKNMTPEQIEANKKFKALKDIYNSVGNPVAKDRLININSLAVVSQAVNRVMGRLPFIIQRLFCEIGYSRDFYEYWESDGYGTCTYSGDLNLSLDKDFDLFEGKVTAVLRSIPTLQLLQIPHHGSKTSYNKRFCGGLSGACFVNFNSGNSIFDKRITYDFFCARKELIPVTEIGSSRLVQEFLIS